VVLVVQCLDCPASRRDCSRLCGGLSGRYLFCDGVAAVPRPGALPGNEKAAVGGGFCGLCRHCDPLAFFIADPEGIALSAGAEEGRLLFSRYGCNSCHSVSGHGRRVAVDISRIEGQMSREELFNYIRRPPKDVPMPSFDHMPEEHLERVVDYVLAAQTFPRES